MGWTNESTALSVSPTQTVAEPVTFASNVTFNGSVTFNGIDGAYQIAPAPSGGDDYATLQALINALAVSGTPELVLREGTYLLSAELQIPTDASLVYAGFTLRGVRSKNHTGTGTTLRATSAGMRSCLAVLSRGARVEDLWLDANRKASYGIYLNSSVWSNFSRVMATGALIDGWYIDENSGPNIFDGIFAVSNGTLYLSSLIASDYTAAVGASMTNSYVGSTASMTASSSVVTIAGGPDLTTLGIRRGDMIRIGSNYLTAFYARIDSVTNSTTLALAPWTYALPTATAASQQWAIAVGDGFHHAATGNSNISTLNQPYLSGNACCGYSGLQTGYGDELDTPQMDLNGFFAFSWGRVDGSIRGGTIANPYSENNVAGSGYISSGDLVITGGTQSDSPVGGLAKYVTVNLGTPVWIHNGYTENLVIGAPQNILIEVNNNAGTLRHRMVADHYTGSTATRVDKLTSPSITYNNTPDVSGGATAFVAGLGIAADRIILDTAVTQTQAALDARVEFNDTGTAYIAVPFLDSTNVNGVTQNRIGVKLQNPATGALANWTTATIPAGKTISIRYAGTAR